MNIKYLYFIIILVFDGSSLPDPSILEHCLRKTSLGPETEGMASSAFGLSWNTCWNSPLGMDRFMLGSSPVLL